METLTGQIDRFVRWFFNSSPDQTSIEPRPVAVRTTTCSPPDDRCDLAANPPSGPTAVGRRGRGP
jgi:hypothetical protein